MWRSPRVGAWTGQPDGGWADAGCAHGSGLGGLEKEGLDCGWCVGGFASVRKCQGWRLE
jgi:hypothetical protein